MSLPIIFSTVGMVAVLLIRVMGSLSGPDMGPEDEDAAVNDANSLEAVHQAAGLFTNKYQLMVDEIISFQKAPDYQRAEARRQELAALAASHVGKFQDLADTLQAKLGQLAIQDEASDSGTTH